MGVLVAWQERRLAELRRRYQAKVEVARRLRSRQWVPFSEN